MPLIIPEFDDDELGKSLKRLFEFAALSSTFIELSRDASSENANAGSAESEAFSRKMSAAKDNMFDLIDNLEQQCEALGASRLRIRQIRKLARDAYSPRDSYQNGG